MHWCASLVCCKFVPLKTKNARKGKMVECCRLLNNMHCILASISNTAFFSFFLILILLKSILLDGGRLRASLEFLCCERKLKEQLGTEFLLVLKPLNLGSTPRSLRYYEQYIHTHGCTFTPLCTLCTWRAHGRYSCTENFLPVVMGCFTVQWFIQCNGRVALHGCQMREGRKLCREPVSIHAT